MILSFPGSAWERAAPQAPPADTTLIPLLMLHEAEPREQCVPTQSVGTRKPTSLAFCSDGSSNPTFSRLPHARRMGAARIHLARLAAQAGKLARQVRADSTSVRGAGQHACPLRARQR